MPDMMPPELSVDEMAAALSAWRPGPTRDAIVAFLQKVTVGPQAVPLDLRVAAFDHDGTTACEKPHSVLGAFLTGTGLKPDVSTTPGILGKAKALLTHGEETVDQLQAYFTDRTVEEYEASVREFLAASTHPRFHRGWDTLGYLPMLQLYALLRRIGFAVFVVSGGSRDMLRVFSLHRYDVTRENVIGSEVKVVYDDGRLVRKDEMTSVDVGRHKPAHLWARAGARALFAGGNTIDDLQLLESAQFRLVINHDDAEREYAYTHEDIVDEATDRGWTVVSMRDDFATVFADEQSATPREPTTNRR